LEANLGDLDGEVGRAKLFTAVGRPNTLSETRAHGTFLGDEQRQESGTIIRPVISLWLCTKRSRERMRIFYRLSKEHQWSFSILTTIIYLQLDLALTTM